MGWIHTLRFEPGVLPVIVIFGGLLFQLLNGLIIQAPHARTTKWWIGILASSLVLLLARTVHRATTDPAVASMAVRAQFAVGIGFAPLAMAAVESLLEYPRPSRALLATVAISLVLLAITVATPWIVPDTAVPRHDALGQPFWGVGRTNLLVLAPYFIGVGWPLFRRMRALPTSQRATRRTIRIATLCCIVTGVNDTLLSAGAITSIHLFEFAFAFVAAASMTYTQRRSDDIQLDIQLDLQRAVDARTSEIGAALTELQQSEQRYRDLADSTIEGVLVLDGPRVVDANAAFHALFETSATMIGARAIDLFGPLTEPASHAALDELLAHSPGPLELVVRRAAGPAIIELRGRASSQGMRRVVTARDISEQRELHRQLLRSDRLAAMGTLAAGAAHEINNPLSYVLANAETLAELLPKHPPPSPELVAELIADITTGASRIQSIVRDLMSLARERADVLATVDVRQVLQSSIAIVQNQLKHRARIIRSYADDVPLVTGNEVRLGQVFLNLLVNAADALPDGRAHENEIELVVRRGPADTVIIQVRDSGSGMTADVRDRIFDPFYTTKGVGRGTGLGLSVSHGIVTALGGTIDVASTPGVGTTFTVQLPAAPAAEVVPVVIATATAPEPLPARTAHRVLVVDDDPAVARMLARVLRPAQVVIVDSGRAALKVCALEKFEVIVCDLMMPELTGMDVHAAIIARDPELATRMIFVTGGVFTESAATFLAEIDNTVLEKPVRASELRDAVAAIRERTAA